MFRKFVLLAVLALLLLPTLVGIAQEPQGLPVEVPGGRENLWVFDRIYRLPTEANWNIWKSGIHTAFFHALMHETFWNRDQETGEFIHALAAGDPVYNDDFTEMSVELRQGVKWSDGEDFNADDVVYTINALMNLYPGGTQSGWSVQLEENGASIEKTGDYSVMFSLGKSNPRFHTLFESRWNGVYMMPSHVVAEVEANLADGESLSDWHWDAADMVVLGNYLPIDWDDNGYWQLFQRREDPENSLAGIITGGSGPPYALGIWYGNENIKKAIAMSRGELDVYFDVDIESFEYTLDNAQTARSWFTAFPWAYPNEVSSRAMTFNLEGDPLAANKDVRWALALAINIVELQTQYIGGIAKVTPFNIPPTPNLYKLYHEPLEQWLIDLQIDLGDGEMYNPYDPTVPDQIAAWAEDYGHTVPGAPRDVFGSGWWKFDTDAASKLLMKAGLSRNGSGQWLTPDGEVWSLDIQSDPSENDAYRMGQAAADMWGDFGIDVNFITLDRSTWTQNHRVGAFEVSTPWQSFALASGDMWPNVRGYHSRYYAPSGEDYNPLGGNSMRRQQETVLDDLIDAMEGINPVSQSEENLALAHDFVKHWVTNMLDITTIAFKKFVTWDEKYWTGFPTAENPNYQPLYWFMGGKFAIQNLTPTS